MSASTAPAAPDKLDGPVLKVAGVVVLGAIMSILDITVVSVALPTFANVFDTTLATVAWTMTGYTLALATVIPATGWAADRFGTKRLYIAALVLFTAGSVLCAAADSIEMLIAFRVLQGLGGGMLMPLGMTILTRAAGPERIGRLMAVLGVPMLLGPISGPILGGYLIDQFSWHWIFLINLPIGIIAIIVAMRVLPKDTATSSESFDLMGMLLLSPGLAAFLFGVSSIAEGGNGVHLGPRVWVSVTIGLLLITAFVFHAFRPEHPLIDLRLFANRRLTVAVVTMFVFIVAFMGAGLLFPSYFLQVRGETTLMAGLLIAPQGLGAMIMMPVAGFMADKIPVGRTVPFFMLLIAAGFVPFTMLGAETSYWLLGSALFVMGLGMGGTMMPIMTSALKTLTNHEVARGSTLVNIVQQVGSSVGAAVLSVILTNSIQASPTIQGAVDDNGEPLTEAGVAIATQMQPGLLDQLGLPGDVIQRGLSFAADAFSSTFMVALALVLVAIVPALFLPRKREESAMLDAEDAAAAPIMLH
ncbi:DHA2 family efflux MFS transporter permease subunit [Aeromicrobium sp. Sec7.5]|uniref:DHA2 family efflux MFS transporter permease subunit n=1 Tax=Aeromicrobium sp. Sec7.5 TaxID=3121276 RepID=UPI002FE4844F